MQKQYFQSFLEVIGKSMMADVADVADSFSLILEISSLWHISTKARFNSQL